VTFVMWNLVSVHLEIVLVLVQDRCTICAKCTIASKIVLDAPDAHSGPFGDTTNLDARSVHCLCRTYHTLGNHCWMNPMDLLGDVRHVESRFCPFGDSVSVSAR
jgi:hypothetical protein